MAVVFDPIALATARDNLARAAHSVVAAGIITGLLAAVFGAIDWRAIPSGTRAKRIGAARGLGKVVIVVLFAGAWLLRRGEPEDPSGRAVLIEVVGVLGALVTSWLGGELVDRLGVGVDPDAHPDAPSSLSGRPARRLRTGHRSVGSITPAALGTVARIHGGDAR